MADYRYRTGLRNRRYSKVKIHRATAERDEKDNNFLFTQLRENERARVAHHIASEELLLEESMSEAYTRLIIPRPVGVSKDSMDDYREEYADGKLRASGRLSARHRTGNLRTG